MNVPFVTIIAFGIILYCLISARLRQTVITAPMAFVAFGLLVGEGGLQLVNFRVANEGIYLLAELTLVVVLFADVSRIDLKL